MSHLTMLISQFARDESGAALVEYAVIFAILLAGTVAALNAITPELGGVFADVTTILANIAGLNP